MAREIWLVLATGSDWEEIEAFASEQEATDYISAVTRSDKVKCKSRKVVLEDF